MTLEEVNGTLLPNYTIQHQKVAFSINLDDGSVNGSIKFTIKPLNSNLKRMNLNARDLEIHSVKFNDEIEVPRDQYSYLSDSNCLFNLPASDDSTDILKNSNKLLRNLGKSMQRELEISVPENLIKVVEVEANSSMTDETIKAPVEIYQSIFLTINYSLDLSKLNFGSVSMYKAIPKPKNPVRYVQLVGRAVEGMGRYLMPCADFPGERFSNWDLEYSVKSGEWQDVFDRIHLVSSGVLCRQFVNEEKTVKVFHYKIQDIPCCASQISFLVGIFDAVKIPYVPFAYAFSPIGKSSKLSNCMEFFGKSFNFYNWFLNSSGGNLKNLNSLSSEVFPFPSYYVAFVKDLPKPFITLANLTLISSDILCEATEIDQTFETRRILCRALAEQYFNLRIDLKSSHDGWILKGIVNYLSEIQLRTFHGNNDYRLKIKKDIERLVELENSENLYVPPLATLNGYLQDQMGKLNPIDRESLEEILELKSRLVFILLERKIERTFLQKLLSHIYAETLINRHRDGFSCQLFLKLIKRLTGKDLKSFTDQWIFNSGCPMFSLNFLHNRKRSMIEFEIASLRRSGGFKFSGNLTIRIVEGEMIVHEHVVHIDESTTKFDVSFHSKAKKPRKKKITPSESNNNKSSITDYDNLDEEMEDDIVGSNAANNNASGPGSKKPSTGKTSSKDEEEEALNETLVSPISWIRIDPEMEWLAEFSLAQPDIMWIEALENDRDVVAQWEAVKALPKVSSTSESVCFALERFINDWKAFWAVRVEAVNSVALIGAGLQELPVRLLGARKLVELFNKKFGHSNAALLAYPKANSFEIFPNYFLQCAVAKGVSLAISAALEAAPSGDFEPLEPFLAFFADALKYNDNASNAGYSDGEYLSTLIRAGTCAFARIINDENLMSRFRAQFTAFCSQLNRHARLELILPSHRNAVMSAVLEATSILNSKNISNCISSELLCPGGLEGFLGPFNHSQVRLDVYRFLVGHLRENCAANLSQALSLLDCVSQDKSVEFRQKCILDVSTFELLQMLLNSMTSDDTNEGLTTNPVDGIKLKEWLHGKLIESNDLKVLKGILSGISVLEGSALDELPSNAAVGGGNQHHQQQQQSSSIKLKITLNIGAQASSSTTTTDPSAASSITEAVSMASTPSLDDDDDIWLRELTGDSGGVKGKSTAIKSSVAAPSTSNPSSSYEKEALLRVWQNLWSNYDSIPFRYPVDPSVPGYYSVIKRPMDLTTARDRINNLTNFLMDLRLIFQNCFTFNQTDSLIYEQAQRLRNLAISELKNAFPREKKLIKKILKSAQEDQDLLESIKQNNLDSHKELKEFDDDVFMTPVKATSTTIPKLAIKLGSNNNNSSNTTFTSVNVNGISPGNRQKLKNILQKLCKHRHAYFFLEPVDPIALNIPTYFDVIKNPMDFGTIKAKLANYLKAEDFASDVRLVFSNCKTFNSPETLVYQVAVELGNIFEADWSKFLTPSSPKKLQLQQDEKEKQEESVPKIKLSLNLGIKKQPDQ